MKYMTHNEIRNMWFKFFTEKKHKILESAPLIPINDNSLLWINAGVVPLKKYFDGTIVPECRRITNIQKCIRTNDIENVGVTKRHQTFFEMMGNFSIGDYFKKEAIEFSYELLTSDEYFQIPKEKLYVTVYTNDKEAKETWLKVGLPESHIIKLDGNFWEIGEGPCGPDSEIFFDRGEKYDKNNDAFEKFKNDEEQERYIEIWNNVFSQYNSTPNTKREDYKELPHKNIDTGAGLERWCIILQDKDSSFETDLFTPIIDQIEKLTNINYQGQTPIKIIADHIRTITFALADGACFENVGRGYVLRRLLRRSVRTGKNLGLKEPFMYKLVGSVIETMKDAYKYLPEKRAQIETTILEEEKLFFQTLDAGEKILKEMLKNVTGSTLSGSDAFKLYDTYGFPFELTEECLNELGYTTNKEEFDKCMQMQKELAKKKAKTKTQMATQKQVLLDFKDESTFVYGLYRLKSKILAIITKDKLIDELTTDGYIALERTCFYAESGGQISDTGMIVGKNFKARVLDVFKGPNGQHIHKIKLLDGKITKNEECEMILDKEKRKMIEHNHSSVHLLHYALRSMIDDDIRQAGSYVSQDKLRFDFTYSGKLTDEKILAVEKKVNEMIEDDYIVSTEIMPLEKAKQLGAMALFGEKYKDIVRVVKIGKSIELCGGTHASNTAQIKHFAIYSYESKGSNVYRIEATTDTKIEQTLYETIKPYSEEKIKLFMKAKEILDNASKQNIKLNFDVDIKTQKLDSYDDIIFCKNELSYVQTEVKELEKKYLKEKEKITLNNLDIYRKEIKDYNDKKAIIMKVDNMDMNLLKTVADTLINEIENGIVFFINIKNNESINFICRSNSNINAGYLIKNASIKSSGNGGGSKTFAQGGGKDLDKIEEIINYIKEELLNEQ